MVPFYRYKEMCSSESPTAIKQENAEGNVAEEWSILFSYWDLLFSPVRLNLLFLTDAQSCSQRRHGAPLISASKHFPLNKSFKKNS